MPEDLTDGHRPPTALISGRIVLAVSRRVARQVAKSARAGIEFDDLRVVAETFKLDLRPILAAHPDIPTRRLVDQFSTVELLDLEETARRNGWPPRRSLTSYWILDTRRYSIDERRALFRWLDPASLESVDVTVSRNFRLGRRARQFYNWTGLGKATLGGLEMELAEQPPVHPDGTGSRPTSPVWAPRERLKQAYLGPSPLGIDARSAWDRGYRGDGVKFVDIETGWFFEHELLRTPADALIYNDNRRRYGTGHGTKVLGVIAAAHGDTGTLGIAPHATVRVASRRRCRRRSAGPATPCRNADVVDRWDVAGAIVAAVRELDPGDVLLLEVQTKYGYPLECVEHCFDAIRVAVGNGIVVVEPAGNGTRRVDRWLPPRAMWQGSFGLHRDDSGAILVGSCERDLSPLGRRRSGHGAISHSSYGSRIDCYAWGEAVATTGPRARRYVADFGGTSAAAAIIAGAAILVQQMHEMHTNQRLAPHEMRTLLRDPRLGTECFRGGVPRDIGVMPNLREIARVMEQLAPSDVPDRRTRGRSGHTDAVLKRANRSLHQRRFSRSHLAPTMSKPQDARGH